MTHIACGLQTSRTRPLPHLYGGLQFHRYQRMEGYLDSPEKQHHCHSVELLGTNICCLAGAYYLVWKEKLILRLICTLFCKVNSLSLLLLGFLLLQVNLLHILFVCFPKQPHKIKESCSNCIEQNTASGVTNSTLNHYLKTSILWCYVTRVQVWVPNTGMFNCI